MQLIFDVDALSPEPTGIGRYCWELAHRLDRRDTVADVHFYREGRLIDHPQAFSASAPRRPKWRRRFDRAIDARRMRRALYHSPNYFLPDWVRGGIITVHDLSVLRFPETHPPARVEHFRTSFQSSLDRAHHIITDSHWNRAELIDMLGVAPNRVTAIHLGVEPRFSPDARIAPSPVPSAPSGYGLCLAAQEPRKRLTSAVAAWARLPDDLRRRYPLVVAGAAGWRNEEFNHDLERGEAEGWLIRLGYIAEPDLPALYAHARTFLFPSIYEGFGLPPLEAMASGVPVVCSNRSCLPEITAGAAIMVDPDEIDAMASAVARLLSDDDAHRHAREAGLAAARGYSWDRCFDQTLAVYRHVWAAR